MALFYIRAVRGTSQGVPPDQGGDVRDDAGGFVVSPGSESLIAFLWRVFTRPHGWRGTRL